MANPILLDVDERKRIISEIQSAENKARKLREQRKFDIYRKRQAPYVLERLQDEFDASTVQNMRKVLSINPCKRIVDEQASLYVDEPNRHWTDASDAEGKVLDEIYNVGMVNPQLRLANRYYKLHGQSCLYVLPKDGKLRVRALTVKDYDVIPDADDSEKAFAYVLNVFDYDAAKTVASQLAASRSDVQYNQNDNRNQTIADANDKKAQAQRYVFWTKDMHFTCNGRGEIVSESFQADDGSTSPVQPNPIGRLPFIDIANEKDFNFFVNLGSDVAEFVVDFLTQLSDLANTCRFQNYSQAIVYSAEQPKNMRVGPNSVIWLKLDPNAEGAAQPKFAFESPSPDIMGSLEFLNVQLKMFLSSAGLNPGTVSGKNEMEKFMSGIDHLLANLDKFKASKEDMDIFRRVECELFDVLKAWHDAMFDVTDDAQLLEEIRASRISDGVKLDIVYKEPQAVQTDSETEDYCIKAVEAGLMTIKEAVKRMYKVEDDKADEIVKELEAEAQQKMLKAQQAMSMGIGPDGKPLPAPGVAGTPDNADPYGVADPGAAKMDGNGKPGTPVDKLPKPLSKTKEA
jgi:hypothetical protein